VIENNPGAQSDSCGDLSNIAEGNIIGVHHPQANVLNAAILNAAIFGIKHVNLFYPIPIFDDATLRAHHCILRLAQKSIIIVISQRFNKFIKIEWREPSFDHDAVRSTVFDYAILDAFKEEIFGFVIPKP
jgi:hypothetical protein